MVAFPGPWTQSNPQKAKKGGNELTQGFSGLTLLCMYRHNNNAILRNTVHYSAVPAI